MRSIPVLVALACAACGHPRPAAEVVQNRGGDDCPAVRPAPSGRNRCGVFVSTIIDAGEADDRVRVFGDSYVASQLGRYFACARGACWIVANFKPGTMTSDVFVSPTCRTAAVFLRPPDTDAPDIYVVDLCGKGVAHHDSEQALDRIVHATWLPDDAVQVESSGHTGVGWTEVFSRQAALIKRFEHGP